MSDYVIKNPKDYAFLERTVTQSLDRGEMGYPSEWQFVLRRKSTGTEQEVVYYAATEDCPSDEFVTSYRRIVGEYIAANPTITFEKEDRHQKQGIHHDQRFPAAKNRRGGYFYSTELHTKPSVQGVEDIYQDNAEPILFTDLSAEIKAYLSRHPKKLYELTPRKFEELIADILKDFGFETELTSATRDGGRDIYAYVRNTVTSFLMCVECKRWAPPKNVGIDVVQRVYGAAKSGGAHKAMIVTTSFFTLPAQQEQKRISTEMELKDYDALRNWLNKYSELPILPGTLD